MMGTLLFPSKNKFLPDVQLRYYFSFSFFFFRADPWHMEVPRLGVKSELQLPAYATAIAMPDLSRICDLHHSSQQCQIPDPLSEARDQTSILMDASWIRFRCTTMGTPSYGFRKQPPNWSSCFAPPSNDSVE